MGIITGLQSILGSKKRVQFIKNGNTVIEFEASLNETHSRQSTPTEFPIEDGTVISDHMILKPFELELTVIVTDKPINGLSAALGEASTVLTASLLPPGGAIAAGAGLGGLSLFSSLIKNSDSPSVAAYKQLLKIQEMGETFTCLTSLYRYENMVISTMSVPREATNGNCIVATLGLRQLTIVRPKTVSVNLMANPGLSSGITDTGQQSTVNINGAPAGYASSQEAIKSVGGSVHA